MTGWDTVGAHPGGLREFAEAQEAQGFEEIHRDAMPWLPAPPGLVLEVGAGSGRGAAWFARRGSAVVAAEPAGALREEARQLHPDPATRWVADRPSGLGAVHRLGLGFDLVGLSGVWPSGVRLATLLRPGGRMVVTLRHGPAPADRPMWPVDLHAVERLGPDHGLAPRIATAHRPSALGAAGVTWKAVILDLPGEASA